MKKTIIFVEDGSVDVEALKEELGGDTLVLTYRKGATVPVIQQPREPIMDTTSELLKNRDAALTDIGNAIMKVLNKCKISLKVRSILERIYGDYFDY